MLQFVYAMLGGWGWGYAKVSWLPYLLGTTIFGLSPMGFRATSIALAAAAFTLLFQVLRSHLNHSVIVLLAVACVASVPTASIFQPSVDHVVYFLLFAIPSAYFLAYRPTDQKILWLITFLAIGVMFRLTVSFVLIPVIFSYLFSARNRGNEALPFKPLFPISFLTPYALGTLMAPALALGGVQQQPLTEQDDWAWMGLVEGQLGLPTLLVLVCGLLTAVLSRNQTLPTLIFVGLISYFYFFALSNSGLAGEPKYTMEWATSLTILSVLWGSVMLTRLGIRRPLGWLAVSVLILASNLTGPIWSAVTRSTIIETRASVAPVGYLAALEYLGPTRVCQPVGVVYGAGSEISLNKAWFLVNEVITTHGRLQARIASEGREWSLAYADLLVSEGVSCAYGARTAFHGLESGKWLAWNVAFKYANSNEVGDLLVLTRTERMMD